MEKVKNRLELINERDQSHCNTNANNKPIAIVSGSGNEVVVEKIPSSPVYFLRTLLLVGGFLLQVPFDIVINNANNCYASHVCRIRRVIISILQIALTLQLFVVVYRGLSHNHTLTNVIIAIINLALNLWINVVIATLWTQRHVFANICTDLEHVCNILEANGAKLPSKIKAVSFAVIICFGGLALTFLEIIFLDLKVHKQDLDVPSLLAHRVQYIFLGNLNVSYDPTKDSVPRCYTVMEMVGGVISLIVKFHYLNVGHFGYILMFSFCFLLGQLFGMLNSCLKATKTLDQYKIQQIIEVFREICTFTRQVNDAIGFIVSWGILAHLPYNAYKTKDLIINDTSKQISYLVHAGIYAAVLMAGADANAKAKAIVEKLATQDIIFDDKIYYSKISILLHQTSNNRIGVRGGKLFVITYGFFGNILGIILTYSILIAQFQHMCK